MEKLFEEVLISKQEIKSAIEASEVRLLLKIESYSEKIRELEKENTELKQRIEILDRNSRKNNIVVFGLAKNKEESSVENVCKELNYKLGLEINKADINNIYQMGKSNDCPIKIELLSTITKIDILKNCKKLKGTKISISADLTKKQQEINKILRKYLKKLRESGEENNYIRGEKLYRNNIEYTAEEILEIEESIKIPDTPRVKSAPETSKTSAERVKNGEAERVKNGESEPEKVAKRIKAEGKGAKKEKSINKQIDNSFAQRTPEAKERKKSSKKKPNEVFKKKRKISKIYYFSSFSFSFFSYFSYFSIMFVISIQHLKYINHGSIY